MKKILISFFLFIVTISLVGCSVPPEQLNPKSIGNLFNDYGFDIICLDDKSSEKVEIDTLFNEPFYQELASLKLTLREGVVDELEEYKRVYIGCDKNSKDVYMRFCGQDDEIVYATVCMYDLVFEVETNVLVFEEFIKYLSGPCPFKWAISEEGHSKVMLCDCCDAPDVVWLHEDYDEDLYCDVCGYYMGQTPTNHFLRNLEGCEWFDEINIDDIVEVRTISECIGVAPGKVKEVSSSTSKAVISRIFEDCYWMDTTPISKEEGQISGGTAVTIEFILSDGTMKNLYINNGNYKDSSGEYYELSYIPGFNYVPEYTTWYQFITYTGIGRIGKLPPATSSTLKDEVTWLCYVLVSGLKFVETDILPEVLPSYCIETEFGELIFYTNTVFTIGYDHSKVYQLIGKDLNELIEEELSFK